MSVYSGVSADALAAFSLDCDSRAQWDSAVRAFIRLQARPRPLRLR